MTAPSKVPSTPRLGVRPGRGYKPRRFAVSDGAPVEVVEDGPSLAGRLMGLAAMATVKPFLTVGSYAPKLPWPWGLVDFAARVLKPAPGTVRATIGLPHCDAQLVRAAGVLPADGKRSVVLYMHGGAFLTCGVNTHGRLVTALSRCADAPVLVVNYRMIPKHSVGTALDDCFDAYRVAAGDRLRAGPDRAGRRLRGRLPGTVAGRAPAVRRPRGLWLRDSRRGRHDVPAVRDRQRDARRAPERPHRRDVPAQGVPRAGGADRKRRRAARGGRAPRGDLRTPRPHRAGSARAP